MKDEAAETGTEALLRSPPQPARVALPRYVATHLVLVPLALAGLAWACQRGAFDFSLSARFFDAATQRFAWHDAFFLEVLGHQAARGLPVMLGAVALAAGVAGFRLRPLRPWRAIFLTLAAATLLGPLLVNLLRTMTAQHCPIDQQPFGGVIDYALERAGPFWAESSARAGHCLPSGHAGGGYALLSLYFAGWAAGRPAWRWRGLAIGVAAGVLFSLVRIAQGAQFASATLWAGAVDWTVCALLFLPVLCAPTKALA